MINKYFMLKNKFLISIISLTLLSVGSCKKISTDLNVNPNVPDKVDPKFSLSAGLVTSADILAGNPGGLATTGNQLFNSWMGYYTVSGDFVPNGNLLRYNITNAFGNSNWDNAYLVLENYQKIIDFYGSEANGKGAIYTAMARIMKAMHFARLVDIYNNIPYSEALQGATNSSPKYDNANTVYDNLVADLNSVVALINSPATASADNPLTYDVLFGGDINKWKALANTLKLKLLVHQSHLPSKAAYITANLAGLSGFLVSDAAVQPTYANDADSRQNPLWNDIGFTTTNNSQSNRDYFRANKFAVDFYSNNADPRISCFYVPNSANLFAGRIYGSAAGSATEGNASISALGGNKTGAPQTFGTLKSVTQPCVIFSASESMFLQTEAIERGFLPGGAAAANAMFNNAVLESFKTLGVASASTAATTYVSQANVLTNLSISGNRMNTIITQKWAAMNTFDPVEAWTDWRRLNIPNSLPVSIYTGTTAPHIPYRLPYPTSEANLNPANVAAQGNIDPITSKIFWMP